MYKNKKTRPAARTVGCLFALGALGLGSAAHAAEAFSPNSKWMLGDWGGKRTELLEKGYDFKLEYVGEAAANLDGGYDDDKTGRYTDQFALGVHMDLEKILGWKAAEFQFTVTERNGKNLSNDRIGDPRAGHISSVQEVWGRGQTWRLTQLWLKQQYFDGALDVKFGRFGEGEDFNSFPCDFQNLAFCGSQVGNWAGSIWYNWPVSQWALRVKYNFAPDWYVQVGAYEQNPSNLETGNGFKMSGSGTKGALLPVELIWQPKVGAEQLPGEYRLGYYYSTAKADDVYDDVDGQPQADRQRLQVARQQAWLVGGAAAGHFAQRRCFARVEPVRQPDGPRQGDQRGGQLPAARGGLQGSVRCAAEGRHRPGHRAHPRQRRCEEAPAPGEPGERHRRLRQPAVPAAAGHRVQRRAVLRVHVTDWLTVRPNLQYIKQPGGVDEVDNALVAGIKIQTVF